MRVKWYCGVLNIESESEEERCSAEGEAEVDEREWKHHHATVVCPECGAGLHQVMDHLEPVVRE